MRYATTTKTTRIMAIGRMFKLPKYKTFTYSPRYYNPRKDRIEKLVRQLEAAQQQEPTLNIRKAYANRHESSTVKDQIKKSNLRLAAIISLLLLGAYLLLLR